MVQEKPSKVHYGENYAISLVSLVIVIEQLLDVASRDRIPTQNIMDATIDLIVNGVVELFKTGGKATKVEVDIVVFVSVPGITVQKISASTETVAQERIIVTSVINEVEIVFVNDNFLVTAFFADNNSAEMEDHFSTENS